MDDPENRQFMYLIMAGFREYEIEKMTPLRRAGYLEIYNETLEAMYGNGGHTAGDNIPPEIRSQIKMPR